MYSTIGRPPEILGAELGKALSWEDRRGLARLHVEPPNAELRQAEVLRIIISLVCDLLPVGVPIADRRTGMWGK